MVSVDGSFLIQVVNFLFLILFMNIVLYKPIRTILKQRKENVKGLEKSIETFTNDAMDSENAFLSGIKQARAKGLKQKDALIDDAGKEEQKIISEINEKAQANLAETRKIIAKDVDGIRVELEKEIEVFSNAIGKKILGRVV